MSVAGSVPEGVRTISEVRGDATRLVLVRHGESRCSLAGIVGGPKGCTGLSERGVEEAEALRDRLTYSAELAGTTALYSSVLPRAIQTAAIAQDAIGAGLDLVTDCSLCELHPGDGDGLRWQDFVSLYGEPDFDADPGTELCPGGESWTSFVARASQALSDLVSRHRGELVVVVCHAGVVEASMLEFLPVARGRRRLKLRTKHTSLTEWECDDSLWQLIRYNDAAHIS